MGSVLLLGYPPDPPKGVAVAAGVAVTAKIEKTSKTFYGFQQWGVQKCDQFFF